MLHRLAAARQIVCGAFCGVFGTVALSASISTNALADEVQSGEVQPGEVQPREILDEEPITFEARGGKSVDAFEGRFTVPENRADPESRKLNLRYVRFPATTENAGPPIVYLAGGPGGSGIGTAKGPRFPLFMAMRAYGDVIAFDQRGTGQSADAPECISETIIPDDKRLPRADVIALLQESVAYCDAFWRKAGVDPAGYTTLQSAKDIDALRAHLGAEKVSLWGISYGTHLALAAAKEMGPRIERMVMASAEGLDQTVKRPARTDAYFGRLQAVIDADPAARAIFPDIKAMMRNVHNALDAEPQLLSLAMPDGSQADFLLTGEVMQFLGSGMVSDPSFAVRLLWLHKAAEAKNYDAIAGALSQFVRMGFLNPGAPEKWRVMPLAMDVASGIGEARLAQVEKEAKTAILGDWLNFPMPQLRGAMGLDLGDDFRKAPTSDIPVLLLSGALDGRTYPESQQEAFARFPNVSTVTIENAGHNLFMVSPEVTSIIEAFMEGEAKDQTIAIDPPDFSPPR